MALSSCMLFPLILMILTASVVESVAFLSNSTIVNTTSISSGPITSSTSQLTAWPSSLANLSCSTCAIAADQQGLEQIFWFSQTWSVTLDTEYITVTSFNGSNATAVTGTRTVLGDVRDIQTTDVPYYAALMSSIQNNVGYGNQTATLVRGTDGSVGTTSFPYGQPFAQVTAVNYRRFLSDPNCPPRMGVVEKGCECVMNHWLPAFAGPAALSDAITTTLLTLDQTYYQALPSSAVNVGAAAEADDIDDLEPWDRQDFKSWLARDNAFTAAFPNWEECAFWTAAAGPPAVKLPVAALTATVSTTVHFAAPNTPIPFLQPAPAIPKPTVHATSAPTSIPDSRPTPGSSHSGGDSGGSESSGGGSGGSQSSGSQGSGSSSGESGNSAPQGSQGDSGSSVNSGNTASTGSSGDTGSQSGGLSETGQGGQGSQGGSGSSGNSGNTGSAGSSGDTGSRRGGSGETGGGQSSQGGSGSPGNNPGSQSSGSGYSGSGGQSPQGQSGSSGGNTEPQGSGSGNTGNGGQSDQSGRGSSGSSAGSQSGESGDTGNGGQSTSGGGETSGGDTGSESQGGGENGVTGSGSSSSDSDSNPPTAPFIITAGSKTVSGIVHGSTAAVIAGTTIFAGGPASSAGGALISVHPGASSIAINGDSQPLSIPKAAPAAKAQPVAIATIGSHTITASPGASEVYYAGTTLSPNGPHVTIDNTDLYLGSSGLVLGGSSTVTLPSPSSGSTSDDETGSVAFTAAGLTFTPSPSGIAAAGSLIPSGSKAIISGTTVSYGPSGLVIGTSTVPIPTSPPSPSSDESDSVTFTAAGFTFTSSPSGIAVAGSSIQSGSAAVISGTTVSYGPSGLVIGTSTIPVPTPPPLGSSGSSPGVGPIHVFTLGGQTFTANPSAIDIDGTTLTAGGSAVTISGTAVSLGTAGLVIASSTFAIPSGALPSSTLVVGSETFTIMPTAIEIDGTTLSEGASAITVQGTPISLGPSGLVVGSSTVPYRGGPLTAASQTSEGLGGVILAGFGPSSTTATATSGTATAMSTPSLVGFQGAAVRLSGWKEARILTSLLAAWWLVWH